MALDARVRWQAAPWAVAAAVLGAFALVHWVDPHNPGSYPVCPTYSVLGVYCPLCGGLRAANDVTNGDLAGALGSNVLVVLMLPVALVWWARWAWARIHGKDRPLANPTGRQLTVAGAVLLLFAIARNLPWGSALAP